MGLGQHCQRKHARTTPGGSCSTVAQRSNARNRRIGPRCSLSHRCQALSSGPASAHFSVSPRSESTARICDIPSSETARATHIEVARQSPWTCPFALLVHSHSKSKDRRSDDQRNYGALPLSYGATCLQIAPVGFEPTTSGLRSMYSNRQSVTLKCDEVLARVFSYGSRTRQLHCSSQTRWTMRWTPDYQSLLSLRPNEVVVEIAALIKSNCFRQWARAGPSQGDTVALTFPGLLQVRYLRTVIVTM